MHVLRHKSAVPCSAVICEDRSRHLGHNREAVFERGECHAVSAELILAIAADRILTADAELVVLRDRTVAESVLPAHNKDLRMSCLKIMRVAEHIFLEVKVAAKTGKLCRERGACSGRRLVDIVARIRHMLEGHAARCSKILAEPCGIEAAVAGIAGLRMLDILILTVAEREEIRRVLAHRTAECELAARVFPHERLLVVAVRIVVIILICAVVETQRARRLMLVQPRTAVHERIAARIRIVAAHLVAEADRVAHAAEIRVADAHHADHAVRARVTGANAERSRPLLLDIDLHNDCIRLNARIHLDVDILEEAEVIDALHAAAGQIRIERLAGLLTHLTEDDAVLRLLVALDLIALELTLADLDRKRPVLCNVEIGDLGEDVAVCTILLLDRLYILLQHARIQQLAGLDRDEAHQGLC